ncbi:MAG TPA: ABC transporter permease [Chitinophagaceae bacterium]|nr:ABC transporter permease [Chitinophagaceae bacterium]
MKQEERIWILMARKLAGEATDTELKELEDLVRTDPDLHFTIETFYKLWNARPEMLTEEDNADKLLERIRNHTSHHELNKGKREVRRPFLKRNFMFRNYLKTSWRNLLRNKAFSLINITGLAIGMASAILVLVWITHQLSYDQFHEKKDRIYQLYNLAEFEGKKEAWQGTSSLLGPAILLNYPQAEEVFRINWVANLIFTTGEKHLEAQGLFTDPGFLRSLDFPLVSGDKNTALNKAESVILTESFAQKLFNKEEALGKAIRIDSNANFTVTGIIKDLPANTKLEFDYLIPMEYRKKINWEIPKWNDYGVETYVLLKPGVTEQAANKLFRNIVKTHAPDMKNEIFVHPMRKWHLYSKFENGKIAGGQIEGVRMFSIIGAFILLIACINYMNLSTAKSEKRAREVGIRKVVGARRGSLVWQFISESVLIAFLAGIIALVIAELSIDWFGKLVYTTLAIPYSNPYFWAYGILFIVVTGIIAGSYPALYLAAHRPVRVLKGALKAVNTLVTPRKILVVLQFSFAIVFIVCTIVIYRQIKFGQNRDPGFTMENLVYVYLRGDINKNYLLLRNELYNSGAIESVTRTNSPISFIWTADGTFEWQGKDPNIKPSFATFHSDNDFAKTMGIDIIEGRDINSLLYPTDTMAVLLNESAVRLMGFKNPVGQFLKNNQGNWQVVGVVKDFGGSPYHPLGPVIVEGPKSWFGTLSFRLNKNNSTAENLAKISTILKKYNPDYPSDFVFADEDHDRIFIGERHTGKLAALFASLAIFISCLGLYALASYMATNRIKEIGVRKVLGASVMSITTLLSKDFLKLVIISFIIASPIAWWMMHSWLNSYTYRVNISWWVFVVTALLSVMIALITVSFQAIKAAIANPVKSLRTE